MKNPGLFLTHPARTQRQKRYDAWPFLCSALLFFLYVPPRFASAPEQILLPGQQEEAAASSDSVPVSYLYIDGNEEGAGGGHTALRLGEQVYHFQRVSEGFFILDRIPWDGFRFSYSRLQNRNIYESPLELTDVQQERLHRRLNDLVIDHRIRLRHRTERIERIDRLRRLSVGKPVMIHYPALGYWISTDEQVEAGLSQELRHRGLALEHPIGDNPQWLPGDREEIEYEQERHLQQYLHDGFAFRQETFVLTELVIPDEIRPFREEIRREFLERLRAILGTEHQLRPDRARVALELIVSLESFDRSMRQGRWVLPKMALLQEQTDTSMEAPIMEARAIPLDSPELQIFVQMFEDRSASVLRSLSVEVGDASGYTSRRELLWRWNRLLQAAAMLDLAQRRGPSSVLEDGAILNTPSLMASVSRTAVDRERILSELALLETEHDRIEKQMRRHLDYSLFTKNCVTQLLYELEQATEARLPENRVLSGLFVPYMSERYVREAFSAEDHIEHRSFRNDYLLTSPAMRERSTIISREYRFNRRDSYFIFFTEDILFWRPAFGLLNFGAGVFQTAQGVVVLPFDRGNSLARGMRGMAYSLTEIAWISVRKGTFRSRHPLFYRFPSSTSEKKKVTAP